MTLLAWTVVLNMIVLHRADGGQVVINPSQVTSLRSPAGPLGRLSPHGRCMVGLTDGKFITVLEGCVAVMKLLEGVP